MNKKAVCIALLGSMLLGATMVKPDALDGLANALSKIAVIAQAKEPELGAGAKPLTQEEHIKRLQILRAKIKDNVTMTPQEVQDLTVKYLLERFSALFQGFANILGEAISKTGAANAPAAGEAVKRLPKAFADGLYLLYNLMHELLQKEFIKHLKEVRQPLKCFINKNERSGQNCRDYNTVQKALQATFERAKPFLLPFAQALFLGVQLKDVDGEVIKVNGWVPLGVEVVAPDTQFEEDMSSLIEVVNILLNFSDQFNDIIGKSEQKGTPAARAVVGGK